MPSPPTDTLTDLFLALTPERVLDAVEAAGLETRPVCYPLNSFENRVYEVELADRSRVIAKFYRPGRWSPEQISEEHRFLLDCAQAEIPVGGVLPFPDGETLHTIDRIHYALFERRGGRAPDEVGEALARRLGMLAGRLHTVGARGRFEHRIELSGDTYVREDVAWLRDHRTLPRHLEGRYAEVAGAIADAADRLLAEARSAGQPQRVHGDFHLGNALDRDGLLTVVDFDDAVTGPPVQDLWLALPGRDAETRRLREVFLEGYERFRLFDRSTLALIEPLRGLRLVHYAAWLARRWHDPAFPAAWPHFGTEEYWRSELEALEEVLAEIEGEARETAAAAAGEEPAPAEEAEPELTNKDFFWDWED